MAATDGERANAVAISAEPESISPLLEPIGEEDTDIGPPHSPKQRRASMAKRMTGRASIAPSPSLLSLANQSSSNLMESISNIELQSDPHNRLVVQLLAWLSDEKSRRAFAHKTAPESGEEQLPERCDHPDAAELDDDPSLQRLEQIISDSIEYAQKMASVSTADYQATTLAGARRRSSARTLRKTTTPTANASSDTEYFEGDAIVPSADVVLDNSRTLGYTGGETVADGVTLNSKRAVKDREGWSSFKYEILRLTHTLRLKGWRRVSLEQSSDIGVQRLSGALTNAIYVVSPPSILASTSNGETNGQPFPRKPPAKLLLRIYGPNVDHLIDRESELQILRRLARKNIGPRLLGTFLNGRFEQYLNANALTPADLHNPETSKQIAKRMRELHDGIELLPSERNAGPFVWQNWDKWVIRCEEVITWLDEQIVAHKGPIKVRSEAWKARGFVCGTEWAKFRKAVDDYRRWLTKQCGGKDALRSQLVFAHNDTQCGNLLRIEPSGTSPLLLPANEHKQLVVIDFEYANANTLGVEFANHFTEWCYDYHSPTLSYACNTTAYPTPAEQTRFIKAYVQHTSDYTTRPSGPAPQKSASNTSSISTFMLDSRGHGPTAPSPNNYDAEEQARDEKTQHEIERLLKETRLWRVAMSAQWVAWGIVQARVPGMDAALEEVHKRKRNLAERLVARLVHPRSGGGGQSSHERGKSQDRDPNAKKAEAATVKAAESLLGAETIKAGKEAAAAKAAPHVPHEHEIDNEDEDDFDCLAYAQSRAMFFWGDLLELGLVKEEDMPELVRKNAKRLKY